MSEHTPVTSTFLRRHRLGCIHVKFQTFLSCQSWQFQKGGLFQMNPESAFVHFCLSETPKSILAWFHLVTSSVPCKHHLALKVKHHCYISSNTCTAPQKKSLEMPGKIWLWINSVLICKIVWIWALENSKCVKMYVFDVYLPWEGKSCMLGEV